MNWLCKGGLIFLLFVSACTTQSMQPLQPERYTKSISEAPSSLKSSLEKSVTPVSAKGSARLSEKTPDACEIFRVATPSTGVLYFTGNSEWRGNRDLTQAQALQSAQQQLGRSLQARVSSMCQERSRSYSDGTQSQESLSQECQSVVESEKVEVGDLSGQVQYCTLDKSYVLAGKKNTAFQTFARMQVSESRFHVISSTLASSLAEPKLKIRDVVVPVPVPCWVVESLCANEEAGFLYFTGEIKKNPTRSKRLLKKAAIVTAQAAFAEQLQLVLRKEYLERIQCDSIQESECKSSSISRIRTCTAAALRGKDVEIVEEYEDTERLYVRIRMQQNRVEDAAVACHLGEE